MPDGMIGIITGKQPRRRWSADAKLRIVAESHAPAASMNAVAARHDVRASLISTWRRQARDGRLRPSDSPGFVAVRLLATGERCGLAPSDEVLPDTASEADTTCIGIALPDGTSIQISHVAQLPLLRGVLAALRQ